MTNIGGHRLLKLLRSVTVSTLGLLLIVYIVFPFAWSVVSSFQTNNELFTYPPSVRTADPWFTNYYSLFTGKRWGEEYESALAFTWIPPFVLWIPRVMLNTLVVGFATVLLAICLGAPAAYVTARFDFRGKGLAL
ncbi:MAG: hypothetical protein Q8P50_05115, partial [Bacillota bacterium]|nr:hypothetical protein [Bacillota bacterium]